MHQLRRLARSRNPRDKASTPAKEQDAAADNSGAALADWESEGGRGTAQQSQSTAVTAVERGKAATARLAKAATERARSARRVIEIRRLQDRLKTNINALGHDVLPLLLAGEVHIDAPGVKKRMADIATLQAELQRRQASLEASHAPRDAEQAIQSSIANVDKNATGAATRSQSSSDAAASAAGQPADQGGQG